MPNELPNMDNAPKSLYKGGDRGIEPGGLIEGQSTDRLIRSWDPKLPETGRS